MEINILRALASIILIFFLPGILLVYAIFPRKNELHESDDLIYRITLGIALSLGTTVLIGFVLGGGVLAPDPATGKGYFTADNIIISIGIMCLLYFALGWYRGAYPFLGRAAPQRYNKDALPKEDKDKLNELMAEWGRLNKAIKKYDKLEEDNPSDKELYDLERKNIRIRMEEIDLKVKDIRLRPDASLISEELEILVAKLQEVKAKIKECNREISEHPTGEGLDEARARKEKLIKKRQAIEEKLKSLEEKAGEQLYG